MTGLVLALVLTGGSSVYWPGDGHNRGVLSCGGAFERGQHHVAIRKWRGLCGAPARICATSTGRCVWTTIQDSGPWGAVCDGRWRVLVGKLPRGCRRRAVVDMTRAVWRELGRPRTMSEVRIEVYREREPQS